MQADVADLKNIRYVGNRPKNDQENSTRKNLCSLVRDFGCFQEISAEKFYLVNLAQNESSREFCNQIAEDPLCPFIFWNPCECQNISYEAFNMDFGPFNLATTHYFCSKVKVWLDTQDLRRPDKCIVIVLDDSDVKRKLNVTLLVAIAAIVLLNLTDLEIIQRLAFFMMYKPKPGEPKKELIFRERKKFSDVSGYQSLMSVTLEDCIKAFYLAKKFGFYNYYEFDHAEYLFYETVMSGDLNWIVPGKLIAFAGPSDKPTNSKMYHKHPPHFYHQYFKDHGVSTIIRLNEPEYDSSGFANHGFDHHDLIFPDGYPPTSTIATRFIRIVNEAKGAVAVHCYAGIGRTGTLIAAYLMAKYKFSPQAAVAWTRICRPGSVIGEQQDWLFIKSDAWSDSKYSTRVPRISNKTLATRKVEVYAEKPDDESTTTYASAEKIHGQAKALLLTKKQSSNKVKSPKRKPNQQVESKEGGCSDESLTRSGDLILDLGKTVPLLLSHADLDGIKDPRFYRIRDGRYEWKVRFPKPNYVKFKYDQKKDCRVSNDLGKNNSYQEVMLDFRYDTEDAQVSDELNNETTVLPKLQPVLYISLTGIHD